MEEAKINPGLDLAQGQTLTKPERWISLLQKMGGCEPDEQPNFFSRLSIGNAFAYRQTRIIVSLEPLPEDTLAELDDMAWKVLDFTDESKWPALMAEHKDFLKVKV